MVLVDTSVWVRFLAGTEPFASDSISFGERRRRGSRSGGGRAADRRSRGPTLVARELPEAAASPDALARRSASARQVSQAPRPRNRLGRCSHASRRRWSHAHPCGRRRAARHDCGGAAHSASAAVVIFVGGRVSATRRQRSDQRKDAIGVGDAVAEASRHPPISASAHVASGVLSTSGHTDGGRKDSTRARMSRSGTPASAAACAFSQSHGSAHRRSGGSCAT